MKFNIKNLVFKDLSGNEIRIDKDELCQTLGNYIYVNVPNLRWLSIAQDIHSTGECELDELETQGLKSLIKSDKCGLILPVKITIIEELEQKNLDFKSPENRS
jgi:hypothetical protein